MTKVIGDRSEDRVERLLRESDNNKTLDDICSGKPVEKQEFLQKVYHLPCEGYPPIAFDQSASLCAVHGHELWKYAYDNPLVKEKRIEHFQTSKPFCIGYDKAGNLCAVWRNGFEVFHPDGGSTWITLDFDVCHGVHIIEPIVILARENEVLVKNWETSHTASWNPVGTFTDVTMCEGTNIVAGSAMGFLHSLQYYENTDLLRYSSPHATNSPVCSLTGTRPLPFLIVSTEKGYELHRIDTSDGTLTTLARQDGPPARHLSFDPNNHLLAASTEKGIDVYEVILPDE